MAEETYLSDDYLRQLTAIGGADIITGIPTANNRDTIEHVVNAVQIGLAKYFPRERTVLINLDAGSRDGTPDLVKSASIRDFRSVLAASPLRTSHIVSTGYHPSRGAGGALRLLLAAADLLRAKACALVSPDLISITPEWIDALVRPIYREGYDFLSPVYQRHKFDGLMIKNILSPLIRAAYGFQIQEPVGGEFGFSGSLASHFLAQEVWQEDFMRYGSAVWFTTTALCSNCRLCQSFLGPKIHSAKGSDSNLAGTIQHIVGALFGSLEAQQSCWVARNGSQPVPTFGFPSELDLGALRVNRKRLFALFRTGVEELGEILERILSAPTLQEIRGVAKTDEDHCHFSDELWAKTVYEFAASYHRSVMNRDHLLQALTPLYRGRISSYLLEARGAGLQELGARIEQLHQVYERMKPYLVKGWSGEG